MTLRQTYETPAVREPLPPVGWAGTSLSSFVGRAETVDSLREIFAGDARLVTLLGPPGIGKTRLSKRYAELHGARYGGGVWFCDLTAARDAMQARAVVCHTLGMTRPEQFSGRTVTDSIAHVLRERGAALVVLDNFEQLTAAAEEVAHWCERAPELHVLITSRERLRIRGERVVEVGPLRLPATSASAGEVFASEAARLYLDRANAAGAPQVDRDDAADLGALVVALDGIPLAIELASARARTLAPRDMLARLAQRFDLLQDRRRDGEARHATLARAVDWSWDLLTPVEQSVLSQCSVFEGGFSLDAAAQVIATQDASHPPVVEVIEALCDKSLIRSQPFGSTRRFSLYVSIHEYAARKLDSRARAKALDRHAAYFLAFAEARAAAVTARADAVCRQELRAEKDNVLAVYYRHRGETDGRVHDHSERAVRAAVALYPVLENNGPEDELLAMIDRAVVLGTAEAIPPALRGRALFFRGNLHGDRGDVASSVADLEAALGFAEAAEDHALIGQVLVWLSVRYRHAGRFGEAIAACDRGEGLLDGTPHKRTLGLTLAVRGRMRGELGQAAASRRDNERGMAIFRSLGDRWYEGLTLANLAQLDMQGGNLDEARWYYEQALITFREVGDCRFEGRYLGYLGCLDWEVGDRASARRRVEDAIGILQTGRAFNYVPLFHAVLGGLLAEMGDVSGARAALDQADNALLEAGNPAYAAAARAHRGQLDLARAHVSAAGGETEEAARLRVLARQRLVKASGPHDRAEGRSLAALVDCSDDVRFAVRMLHRSLADDDRGQGALPLVVGPEARWFSGVSLGDRRVELTRRGPIRLILEALFQHRLKWPGVALGQQALLEEGWPGQRVQADAGSKRVRVAISELRRLGLDAVLHTRDDGYLLDPQCEVRAGGPSPTRTTKQTSRTF